MSYGYKNDEICEECRFEKSEKCDKCYNHMEFHRKQELIDKLTKYLENNVDYSVDINITRKNQFNLKGEIEDD